MAESKSPKLSLSEDKAASARINGAGNLMLGACYSEPGGTPAKFQ